MTPPRAIDSRAENWLPNGNACAINASKIECLRGHTFDEANTYVTPDGRRQCRTCRQMRTLAYRARKRAKRTARS